MHSNIPLSSLFTCKLPVMKLTKYIYTVKCIAQLLQWEAAYSSRCSGRAGSEKLISAAASAAFDSKMFTVTRDWSIWYSHNTATHSYVNHLCITPVPTYRAAICLDLCNPNITSKVNIVTLVTPNMGNICINLGFQGKSPYRPENGRARTVTQPIGMAT